MMSHSVAGFNLIVILQIFLPAYIHGDVAVNMLQCGRPGTRAVGANITLVSTVSANVSDPWNINMFAPNISTQEPVNVARYFYSPWNNTAYNTDSDAYPFLLYIRAGLLVGDTRIYTWEFYNLPESYNGFTMKTDASNFNDLQKEYANHTLSISFCNTSLTVETDDQNDFYHITSNSSGNFTAEGYCSCSDDRELYHSNGTKAQQVATCSEYAIWEPCQSESLQCWSVPSITNVFQTNYTAGESTPFGCNFTEGFPNSSKILYKINDQAQPSPYFLKSSDNGKNLVCEVVSNYTKATDKTVESPPKKIIVYFPPENANLSNDTIMIPLNETKELLFSFSANPLEGNLSTYVKVLNSNNAVADGLFNWTNDITQIVDTTQYNRVLELNLALAEKTQTYAVCANCSGPEGEACAELTINAGSPNQGGISTGIIIGVAVGVLAVLVIVAVVCFMRRNHGNIKEERINEIYEASPGPGPSIETAYTGTGEDSRSEMTTNVAYEASPRQPEIQDVYTTVNREDKKKGRTEKDETKNGSAAATSAEENVPAVTDVYAMVKK